MIQQKKLDILARKQQLRLKFRTFIHDNFSLYMSTTRTILDATDFLNNEIKSTPQQKQQLIDAFEKEIEPVVFLLNEKVRQ